MARNDPILVEDKIAFLLNEKKYSDITNNLRHMLDVVFGPIDSEATVFCKKTEDFIKPDLIITIGNNTKYLSVKTGRAENVHNEIIDNFLEFLESEGISERTIETIRLFQYGDGTTDGTGKERKEYLPLISELMPRIEEANEELNYRKEFVLDAVYRCVFQGTDENNPLVDAIYFGTPEYGIVTTKKQILSHIRKRAFTFFKNLHIGPLLLRPHSRYSNRDIADERNRHRIIAYWPNLNADLDYISKRYNI